MFKGFRRSVILRPLEYFGTNMAISHQSSRSPETRPSKALQFEDVADRLLAGPLVDPTRRPIDAVRALPLRPTRKAALGHDRRRDPNCFCGLPLTVDGAWVLL
jgi:hypothetical protein